MRNKHKSSNTVMATSGEMPAIGDRVEVYWSGDKKYYAGRITAVNDGNGRHTITYDDGDVELLDLGKERWRREERRTGRSPATKSAAPPPRKRVTPDSTGSTQPAKRLSVASVGAGSNEKDTPLSREQLVDVLANYDMEARIRHTQQSRRITQLEETLRTTNTELAALRGQFAALSAITTPQADVARNAVQNVLRTVARAILDSDDPR